MKASRLFALAAAGAVILGVFGICRAGGQTQAPVKEGLLWEITGNGLTEPSWLLGTYHGTFDIEYNYVDSIPGFHRAFERARLVCGEVDMSDPAAMGHRMNELMEPMPADSSYQVLLSPGDYRFLDSIVVAMVKITGGDPARIMTLRPGVLALSMAQVRQIVQLREKGIDLSTFQVMDSQIMKSAQEHSKATGGLETVSDQFDALFGSNKSLRWQADELVLGLREMQAQTMNLDALPSLAAAYRSQDLRQIERYGTMLDSLVLAFDARRAADYSVMMDELIRGRNARWTEEIPGIIAAQPTLIAVGVRHLPGEVGLITMLREKGYTLTPAN